MRITMYTLLCVLFSLGTSIQAQNHNGEILFHFKAGTTNADVAAIASNWNSTVVEPLQPGGQIAVIKANSYPFVNPYDANDMIVNISKHKDKTIIHEPDGDGGVENYYILNTKTPGSPQKCNFNTTGSLDQYSVDIGIFDTGVNYQQANNVGYTFNNVVEIGTQVSDLNGHGTHVATVLHNTFMQSALARKEALGYTIGAPLGVSGTGVLSDVAYSIEKAVIHGVNVINCSFSYMGEKDIIDNGELALGESGTIGGSGIGTELTIIADPLLQVMMSADMKQTLFVCAAGNDMFDLDDSSNPNTYFPAAFPLDNVISVASHDCDETLSSFSNYGKQSVDIATTGVGIEGLNNNMNTEWMTGTSQATAIVSGAAVIVGSHLATFDAVTVKCAIMTGAQISQQLDQMVVSSGFLDIPAAVQSLSCGLGSAHERSKAYVKSDVIVTPNPFKDEVSIQFTLKESQKVNYQVYDITGKLLKNTTLDGISGDNTFNINFDNFRFSNNYIIRIESNEFTQAQKLVRF